MLNKLLKEKHFHDNIRLLLRLS